MLTVKEILRIWRYRGQYGDCNGSCFGTPLPSELRPMPLNTTAPSEPKMGRRVRYKAFTAENGEVLHRPVKEDPSRD